MTRVDLTQESVDELAILLEEVGISKVALLEALDRLPDLEHGRGEHSLDVEIVCHKCEEEIGDEEMMGVAYGSFYHDGCVPGLHEGPLPLAQYLAGVEVAEGSR